MDTSVKSPCTKSIRTNGPTIYRIYGIYVGRISASPPITVQMRNPRSQKSSLSWRRRKNRRTNLNLPLRNWKCILDAYSREYFLYSLKQVWSGRRRIRTVMYPSQINVVRTGWKEARRAGLATATVRWLQLEVYHYNCAAVRISKCHMSDRRG